MLNTKNSEICIETMLKFTFDVLHPINIIYFAYTFFNVFYQDRYISNKI